MRKTNVIKFLPLLFLYIIIVLLFSDTVLHNDEGRYLRFASNLAHGYYSDSVDINLWNGPGYPVILAPFILLKLPLFIARILNALFLFGTIMYFYNTLCFYFSRKRAIYFTYILGIYPPMIRHMHLLNAESLAFLLISGFIFYFCKISKDKKYSFNSFFTACFYLGYLSLTKTYFGYIILVALLLNLFLYLLGKGIIFKKSALIFIFTLVLCFPWLYYTYSLTGKIYYWGNVESMSLYWMSSPYKNEFGDWQDDYTLYDKSPELEKNHRSFFNGINRLSRPQKDVEFVKKAIYNILGNPEKYFRNWIANIGRMLFSYPFSYTSQKLATFFYIIPNMFIAVLCVLSLYPAYRAKALIPAEIHVLSLFGLIAFGCSSLISATTRQFSILVPVFALWVFFIITNILKVEIRE